MWTALAVYEPTDAVSMVLTTFLLLLALFAFMYLFVFVGWRKTHRKGSLCPYAGVPLVYAKDLPASSRQIIDHTLAQYSAELNPPIDWSLAAICTKTGRLFTQCVAVSGTIYLDWNFLKKRAPGEWVSWGALTPEHQGEIYSLYRDMSFYQTDLCSPDAQPSRTNSFYAMTRPGPLYVNPHTNELLGWVSVPDTSYEILIHSRPDNLLY